MAEDLTTDKTASVDTNYRPYGLDAGNVFVTGAGLLPAAGSWNRTLTSELLPSGLADNHILSYSDYLWICARLG